MPLAQEFAKFSRGGGGKMPPRGVLSGAGGLILLGFAAAGINASLFNGNALII